MFRILFSAIAASAALGIAASPVKASPLPDDKGVGTWVLLPLKPVGQGQQGAGSATLQVDVRARKICYAIDISGLSDVQEVRLGQGPDVPGEVVAQFKKSIRGNSWDNCVEVQPSLAEAILADHGNYFVEVRDSAGVSLRARLEGSGKTLDR